MQMIEFSISGELLTKEGMPTGVASISCKVRGSSNIIISTLASVMDSDEAIREVIMAAAATYAIQDIGDRTLVADIEEMQDNDIKDKLKLSKLMQGFNPDIDLDIN
jgi:hypothetical protein